MKVLVTGANGFVGRSVVARLHAEGHTVATLVRPNSLRPLAPADNLEITAGDLRDSAVVAQAARGCDAAIHLAGIIRERGPNTFQAVHVQGAEHMVSACRSAGMRRLIHLSSHGAALGAAAPYLRSKEAGEHLVRESGLDWTILRPGVIHGPQGEFMITMARMVARPGPVPLIGRGLQMLQPVWVDDIARMLVGALALDATVGKSVEVGGPDLLELRTFLQIVARVLLGHEKWQLQIPTFAVRAGAWVAAHAIEDPPITPDELRMLLAAVPCDIRPMREAFGLDPAPFEPTLAAYAAELRAAAGIADH
jgi:NADH dehydrogenase